MEIDLATIEKGSDYLGMVASIPPEDQFTRWRSEFESDILVSPASLAGELMFFDGDSSPWVSGDLESATQVACSWRASGGWARPLVLLDRAAAAGRSPGGAGQAGGREAGAMLRRALADRIEDKLGDLSPGPRRSGREPGPGARAGARAEDLPHAHRRRRRGGHRGPGGRHGGRQRLRDIGSRPGWRTTTPPPSAPTRAQPDADRAAAGRSTVDGPAEGTAAATA